MIRHLIGLIYLLPLFLVFSCGREVSESAFVPPPPVPDFHGKMPIIEQEKAAIGSKEDPQARLAYETAMLVDPRTGLIPENIKRREYVFSSKLPVKRRPAKDLRKGQTEAATWQSIGPYNKGGRTRALAIDVSNEKVILAGGVSGGMWRTEDGGNNWEKTTVPANIHSVSCIAQDTRPGKTHIWYYGTGEFTSNSASKKAAPYRGDGVFKSADGGKTWTQLASTAEGIPSNYNSQFQYIWKVLPNRFNTAQDEVFLATVGALFRSINGGQTWTLVLGRKLSSTPNTDLNGANISDFVDIVQAIDGTYYAVFSERSRRGSSPDEGVYRSTDGINWSQITPAMWPVNYARTVIATSPTDAREVYFSVNAATERLFRYRYLFGSGAGSGGQWWDLSDNLPSFGGEVGDYNSQGSYNMVLTFHPAEPDVLFLGGTNLYRSADKFTTKNFTTWIGGYDTANNISIFPNHFVDQHALAFYPSDPTKMLSSNDGGVFVTEDNLAEGIVWRSLNNGFVTAQFYTLGLDEFGSKGDIIGGLQDNGTLIAKNPINVSPWHTLLSGDGGYSMITQNSSYYYGSFQYGRIYRFTLDKNFKNKTFARVDPSGSGEKEKLLFVNPWVLAPENQNIMYFAGGDVVWRNLNVSQIPLYTNYPGEINWQRMQGTELASETITAISASYNPAGYVFYGTGKGRVFRINQANSAEYSVDEITSSIFPDGAYVSCIAADKKDSKNLIVAFSNYNVLSLFYSSDGGQHFQNISGNLEEFPDGSGSGPSVRWVEIISKNDGTTTYMVATSTGIYSTETLNGNTTIWEREGSNTVGNVLVTMIRYFSGDGTVIAATHGNGMYEARLDNVWPLEVMGEETPLAMGDAYPNPFRESVKIPFTLPRNGMARARIFSVRGQLIKTILWAEQYSGNNVITWDGTNEAGVEVATGTYICRLEFEDKTVARKIIHVR